MFSETRWRTEELLRLCLGLFISFVVGLIALTVGNRLQPGMSDADAALMRQVVGMMTFHGAILVLVHFLLRAHQTTWRAAFGLDQRRALLMGAVATLVVLPGALALGEFSRFALKEITGSEPPTQEAIRLLLLGMSWPRLLVFGFAAIVLAPVAEEVLFRGVLYRALYDRGHPHLALWGTALLFAAVHGNAAGFLAFLFIGVAMAWLYRRTGSLLAPIATHMLFNATNFVYVTIASHAAKAPPP